METRQDNKQIVPQSHKKPVSFQSIQGKEANGFFYVTDSVKRANAFITSLVKELYHSLSMTFSLDHIDFHQFKKQLWPMISSGVALILGEYLTTSLRQTVTDDEDYDPLFRFLIGSAFLAYCVTHRITEKRMESTAEISAAVAMEVLAITNLYRSTFDGSRMLLEGKLPDSYSLIASLGMSALAVPGGISYLAKKYQDQAVKKAYLEGSQRSDSAVISSGLTSVSNRYLQLNHFLLSELFTGSRLFQLGLISDNILNAEKILRRFRNLPALLADAGPAVIKKLVSQQEKIESDYLYNTTTERVLEFTANGPEFFDVPRYRLKNGDLVHCDKHFDFSSVPVSGEVVALARNSQGEFTDSLEQDKFSVNLKTHNGEDVWIAFESNTSFDTPYSQMDLHAIRDGKQAGVLAGDKLNIYGADNFFIRIKAEKERTLISNYEKKSVINDIINKRKQTNILYAILGSIIMAAFLKRDITALPAEALRLLFNLFQMLIPFSESFLREMVNSRLMKEINASLGDNPMETIDALRVVDLCNALGGYYRDRFPKGVAIVSDKTGTLTTSKMDVLGLWTKDMDPNTTNLLNHNESHLLPDTEKQLTCFDVFAGAYTNEKKDLEPEEFSMLNLFQSITGHNDCIKVIIEGNNHFKKTLVTNNSEKEIETFHLGLYRTFGGRLTLVADGKQKYLIFCGVPKHDAFEKTPLLTSYTLMQRRTGVLSRDWCLARTTLSDEQFEQLKRFFSEDQKQEIERFILSDPELLNNLDHYCTFLINNPVKKGAEKFISQCRDIQVPVFVATGDTAKAAENIAHVLCPENTNAILTIRAEDAKDADIDSLLKDGELQKATVIFAGINEDTLARFQPILDADAARRPVVIFSEMSTEGKGMLAQFLKKNEFFVVANGDGSNDVMMMKHADTVISHLTEDETHAPGVSQLSNISDKQVRCLLHSQDSFYELFDINRANNSAFMREFTGLANSQEKVSLALALKTSKMGFEAASAVGAPNMIEMPEQHWWTVAFDLMWLLISFNAINTTTDLPADDKNLGASNFIDQCIGAAMLAALLEAATNYGLYNESTNFTTMLLMLVTLPIILKSVFSRFGSVQNELYSDQQNTNDNPDERHATRRVRKAIEWASSFFSHKPKETKIEDNERFTLLPS
jgi:P-type Ca2+ transporter type 2C